MSFTYNQVKEYVESKGCILLSTEYFRCQDDLEFIGICGHKYCVPFERFKHHKQYECPSCGNKRTGLKKRLTYDYVYNYVKSKGCELLSSSYTTDSVPLEILFSCGHRGEKSFRLFKKGKSICAKCTKSIKYTLEEIKDAFNGFGFILEDNQDYIGANTKMTFYDNLGYKYHYSFHCVDNARKKGRNIISPFESNNKYALENIKLWIKKNDKPYTVYCEEYKGNHINNMYFHCNVCDKEWKTCWACIYSNETSCPRCAIRINGERSQERNLTEKYNLKFLNPSVSKEWDFERNIKTPDKVLPYSGLYAFWICSICGYKWGAIVSSRFVGRGCPACALSSNEQSAYKFLKENNFNFEIEYEFDDLKSYYDNPLRYDFAILNNDNTIKMLLEIDSKLHDEYIPFFHGSIEEFNIRVQYDEMKDKYAKDHNYKLLRIKEEDFKNIPQILAQHLNLNL